MDEKEKVLYLLELIKNDLVFQRFNSKEEFYKEWEKYIKSIDSKVVYFMPDETDTDQVFLFNLPITDIEMNFCFSIKYIRDFYLKYPNCKQKLVLENSDGRLFNGENECCYTLICEMEIKEDYKDSTEAFVIPFSQKQYNFLVIDGNHRINQKIYKKDKEIDTLYVDYKMAARSLATPMQICAYCILEDFAKIKYNMDKYSHNRLLKSTNISNKDRILNIIGSDRKR